MGSRDRGELPPASYRLSCQLESGGKAHTFCMCPGGMVVPATNHEGRVVVNGMSFSTRMARWANSAVIVAIEPESMDMMGPLHLWLALGMTGRMQLNGSVLRPQVESTRLCTTGF